MIHDHDRGLSHDLPLLISRRRALAVLGGGIGAVLAGCGSDDKATTTATTAAPATSEGAGTVAAAVPEETAGPFPGDGSNGPNVLTESGVVRRDLTRSFSGPDGRAEGVPTTLELTLIDVAGGGKPLAGAAVYLWHCDREGRYSLYDGAISGENYLRGVQASDSAGKLRFDTIYPGAYAGRWPHMHFEVYESLDAATAAQAKLRTSQIALPQDACDLVYASSGYEQSAQNMSGLSLDGDTVFSDGYASQLAKTAGSVEDGLTLRLNIGV